MKCTIKCLESIITGVIIFNEINYRSDDNIPIIITIFLFIFFFYFVYSVADSLNNGFAKKSNFYGIAIKNNLKIILLTLIIKP